MIKELKSLQKKLTNLSGNNKSISQMRLSASQDIDVDQFDFLNSLSSFSLIDFLLSNKRTYTLCDLNDSRNTNVNEASKRIKRLNRQTDFLLEERGVKELFVGWPFVVGKLKNGSSIRCPLLFFPVDIKLKNNEWRLEKRAEDTITFNKSFLLAYSYFNDTKLPEDFIDYSFEETQDSQVFRNELYELIKQSALDINFNSELFEDKLKKFHSYRKDEFESEFKTGIIKLENNATLGIYPQAGSYLVPDYDYWLNNCKHESLEDFFLSKTVETSDKYKQINNVKEEQTFTPYPIDSSQEIALKSIKKGDSIVVQGPPGTGKSQLICNLVCDFIARGKSVLVVSQKRVALDVVHQRLNEKEIGDFVGVVHDFKNDRKKIYEQIERQIFNLERYEHQNNELDTIYLERDYLQTCRKIDQLCETFEEYKTALFDTKECGISAKELYVTSSLDREYIKLTQEYRKFDHNKIQEFHDFIDWVFPYAKLFESEDFSWYERKDFSLFKTSDRNKIKETINSIPTYQADFSNKIKSLLGEKISITESRWVLDRKNVVEDLLKIISPAKIYPLFVQILPKHTDKDWLLLKEKQFLECFKNDGIETTVPANELGVFQEVISNYLKVKQNFFTKINWWLFSKDKYKLKRVLVGNGLSWSKKDVKTLVSKIDNRLNLEHLITEIKEINWIADPIESLDKNKIQTWFDIHLQALEAKSLTDDLRSFIKYIPFETSSLKEIKQTISEVMNWCEVVANQLGIWEHHLTHLQIKKILDSPTFIEQLNSDLDEHFDNLCLYDGKKKELDNEEFTVLSKLLDKNNKEEALKLFQNSIRIAWIDHIETKHPILTTVSTMKFEQDEKELQAAIKLKLKLSKAILLLKAKEQTYKNVDYNRLNNRITYRELEHQVTKKRRIWPIRKLIQEFDSELFNLIPCWMASPESVSAIFSMNQTFDLVVFDEASQCYSEKGLPAIYRAKQVVITGDKHQLSPNDLYQVRFEEEEEVSSDMEIDSLLDLCSKHFIQTQLNGHYRSESLDLIDFSNHHFYRGQLSMIPHSEKINSTEPGINYLKVEGKWENGVNPIEAAKVIEIVTKLIREEKQDIGIVTFNYKQQHLIQDLLDEYAIENNILIPSSIFVKNIENVQGDERDIIIFSIGYAENASGKLNSHFGSLNMEKGENRLNVAITRARTNVIIVTSILPQQLQVDDAKHDGPKLFKKYLEYAFDVSTKKFVPGLPNNSQMNKSWYLKGRLMEELKNEIDLTDRLPFADLEMNKENQVHSLILTDDHSYYNTITPKERHAYNPLRMKTLDWKINYLWSRNFWKNTQKETEKIIQSTK